MPSSPTTARRRPADGLIRRPVVATAFLALAYLAVALLGSPSAGLGSDSGGKLATARTMAESGTGMDPDVGYWAAELDPTGRFHPLFNTERVGDRWVQATSLPHSAIAAALWTPAGPLGPALLSMLGGVATALAARRLARRLGGDPTLAFWLVGLASPVAVYATDAWEHAPSLGLASWGMVLSLEVASRRQAVLVGFLLGAALVFRAEIAASVLALIVAIAVVPAVRIRWTARPSWPVAAALAGGGVLLANTLLERLTLEAGVRTARASAGAADAGSEVGRRATDAVVTGAGLFADGTAAGLLVAGLLVVALGVLGLRASGSDRVSDTMVRGATVLVLGLYAVRVLDGWSFVPGALAVAPVMVLAAAVGRVAEVRVLLITALGAVPVVWGLQWKGNHLAQWGGRYLLLSTVLLLVLAAVALSGPAGREVTSRVLLAATVAVGAAGLGWHVLRTDVVGSASSALEALPVPDEAIVVTTDQHLGREMGSRYGDRRWLSADGATLDEALALAGHADPPAILVIHRTGRPDHRPAGTQPPTGYRRSGTVDIAYLGDDLEVQILDRD